MKDGEVKIGQGKRQDQGKGSCEEEVLCEGRVLTDLFHTRADEKTAAEYSLEGGATLHLVLALRGGCR